MQRRALGPAHRLANIGLMMLVTLLLPAAVLAQAGQVVEYYHLDALALRHAHHNSARLRATLSEA